MLSNAFPPDRWVVLLSGMGIITLPDNSANITVTPGEDAILFVADTDDVSTGGHRSQYLGASESVLLQIPTLDGGIPGHTVLHTGPCTAQQYVGLRDLAVGA
jgi:hypothetical protein